MICCNGNVELQAALNEEEAIWWQGRIAELKGESEIISRNPEEVKSVEEAIKYLKDTGRQAFREALRGSEVAMSVYKAYNMYSTRPRDPGGQAYLEISVNDYIRSKKFTLSMQNPTTK